MARTKKREDKRYEKKITVGRNLDGSLNRISVYAATQKELERKAAEIQVQIEQGIFLSSDTALFGKIAENWVEHFKPTISEKMRLLDNAALAVIAVIVDGLNVMEQIVIDIVHTQMVQLTLERFFDLLFRDHHKGRNFVATVKLSLGCRSTSALRVASSLLPS